MSFLNKAVRNIVCYSLPLILGATNIYPQKTNLKNATILDFENKSVRSENVESMGSLISDSVGMKLRDHLNIVEKQDLENILKENKINLDNLKDIAPSLINEGIDYIIIGNYSVISNDELIINSKLINLRDLNSIETQYIEGSIKNGIRDEISGLVNELIQDLGYEREPTKKIPEPTPSLEQVRENKTGIEANIGKTYFGPTLELSSPRSPEGFKENWNNSVAFGIEFGKISNGPIGLVIPKMGYHVFQLDSNNVENGGIEGGEVSVFNIGGDIVLRFVEKGQVIPFLNLGVGYYNVKFGDVRTSDGYSESGETQSKIGYDIGVGLDFYVGNSYFLSIGAQYDHIETDEKAIGYSSLYGGINFILGEKK